MRTQQSIDDVSSGQCIAISKANHTHKKNEKAQNRMTGKLQLCSFLTWYSPAISFITDMENSS